MFTEEILNGKLHFLCSVDICYILVEQTFGYSLIYKRMNINILGNCTVQVYFLFVDMRLNITIVTGSAVPYFSSSKLENQLKKHILNVAN